VDLHKRSQHHRVPLVGLGTIGVEQGGEKSEVYGIHALE
jgi:hypothetical protein